MHKPFLLLAGFALASCAMTSTTPAAPPVTAALRSEMAPTGVLRAGVNFGNPVVAQKDPAGGPPRGVGPGMAREMARRLGVPVAYVTYDSAGKMADAVKQGAWDVAFLAVDPARASQIGFSAPYVQIEGTYLVRKESPLMRVDEVDRDGIQVAVGDKTAYDLYLTRTLRHARLHKASTSLAAVDLFLERKLDAAAGVKNTLVAVAAKDPAVRVIDGNFMVIGQAAGVPRERAAATAWLAAFIEEAKASGFVARALEDSGIADATVAPAGAPR